MRLSGDPCPVCGNPIRPLDSMRNIDFHGRSEKLHHRCWFENQDLIALLEQGEAELTLAEAVKKARESDPHNSD
jgi:hypothetical protein